MTDHDAQPGKVHVTVSTIKQADGPSPLGWRGYGSCAFCRGPDVTVQHDLNNSLSSFRTASGQGSVWGSAPRLCDRCEQLYAVGDYAALARLEAAREEFPTPYEDSLVGLVAFARADRGPRALPDPPFPDGFEPLDELTGHPTIWDVWPDQHKLAVAETRWPQVEDDPSAVVQLLRSPWSSLDVREALNVLWTWSERDWDHDTTPSLLDSRILEALAFTDAEALDWRRRWRGFGTPPG